MPTADAPPPAPFHHGPELEDIELAWDCDPREDGIAPGDVMTVAGASEHGLPSQALVVAILPNGNLHLLVDKRSVSSAVYNQENPTA